MVKNNSCKKWESKINGKCIHKNLTKLSPNQYWLAQHQITAFWHGFGVSNGLDVPGEFVEEGRFKNELGVKSVYIKPEFMRKQLNDYNRWLKGYKSNWEKKEKHPFGISSPEKFLEDELKQPSKEPVIEMISELQDNI